MDNLKKYKVIVVGLRGRHSKLPTTKVKVKFTYYDICSNTERKTKQRVHTYIYIKIHTYVHLYVYLCLYVCKTTLLSFAVWLLHYFNYFWPTHTHTHTQTYTQHNNNNNRKHTTSGLATGFKCSTCEILYVHNNNTRNNNKTEMCGSHKKGGRVGKMYAMLSLSVCLCGCVCRTLSIHRRNFYCLLEVGIEQQQRRRRSSKQRACARCTGPQRGVGSTHTHIRTLTHYVCVCSSCCLRVYVLVSSGLLLLSACTCTYPK